MEPTIDIIKDLDLENLPEEEKNSLLNSITSSLQTRISLRVIGMLSESEKNEMEALVEQGDDQKVEAYINSKVPGISSIAKEELMKLREELLSGNQIMQDVLSKKKAENQQ